jgi:F-type H+-transporting ATPase subunit epsilon
MADKIAVELISPERVLVSQDADMVIVPGMAGDFGVLAGHQPLISSLRPGIVEVHDEGAETRRIFVDGGFVEVTGDRCAVLAEDAAPLEDLNRSDIEVRIKGAEEDLAAAKEDLERHLIENRLATLRHMLDAAA